MLIALMCQNRDFIKILLVKKKKNLRLLVVKYVVFKMTAFIPGRQKFRQWSGNNLCLFLSAQENCF